MNETITYHRADTTDIGLLADARIAFLTEFWGPQDEAVTAKLRTELLRYFADTLPNENYICWYAMCNNEFAGIGGMAVSRKPGSFRAPDGRSGYIMNMYTVPEFRRRGIGRAILEKLMESGRQAGITFFELHAAEQGVSLYRKNGFMLHNEPTFRKFE